MTELAADPSGHVRALEHGAEALLTREQTANALTAAGYPVRSATLQTMATRGGGPPFYKFGPRVLYRWGSSLSWARGRLTPPRVTTSEADARAVA